MEKNIKKGAKVDAIKKKTTVGAKKTGYIKKQPAKTLTKKALLLKAMRSNLGNVTASCEQVGITRGAYYKYIKEDEVFKEEIEAIAENALDFVESKLFERIRGYEHKEDKIFVYEGAPVIIPTTKHYAPDTTAIIFYLKTRGKERGYVERMENINKNIPLDPFEGKTEAEIDEILRELEQEGKQENQRLREFKKIEDNPEESA